MSDARNSRSGGKPSVGPYWRTRAASRASTRSAATPSSSAGKQLGEGSPPANEITSGCSVILRRSRIAELVMFLAPKDNCSVQIVLIAFFLVRAMLLPARRGDARYVRHSASIPADRLLNQ